MTKWENMKNIAQEDVNSLKRAEESYGDSWKRRGGVGAFMMLARKFDRIENQSEEHNWDIFEAGDVYAGEEGLLDDIRDLRRYLILVENQLVYGDDAVFDLTFKKGLIVNFFSSEEKPEEVKRSTNTLDKAMEEAEVVLDKFAPKKDFKPVEMVITKTKQSIKVTPKRARSKKGRYRKDNKATPNINEAWVGGKAPVRKKVNKKKK